MPMIGDDPSWWRSRELAEAKGLKPANQLRESSIPADAQDLWKRSTRTTASATQLGRVIEQELRAAA